MVNLTPMSPSYYKSRFRGYCIRELAAACVSNRLWDPEGSVAQAAKEQDEALPFGVSTKGNYLFEIQDGETSVGALWLGRLDQGPRDLGFLFEIHIDQDHRGRSFGSEALVALKEFARGRGIVRIRLHVFETNTAALRLYRKSGFNEYQRRGSSLWMETNL